MLESRFPPARLIGWYWRNYVRGQWPLIVVAMVLMAAEGGALGALSYMVRPMFDEIFVGGDRGAVFWIAFVVFAIFIGRAVAGFTQRVLMALVGRRVSSALQLDLVRHMLRLDSDFFVLNAPGTLIERVRGDTTAATGVLSQTFSMIGRDVISLISLLAVALSVDVVWTLIAVAGAPLLYVPIRLLQKAVRKTSRAARNAAAVIATRLDEMFHGINTIKLNATDAYEAERFAKAVKDYVQAEVKSSAAQAGIPAMMDIVAAIGFLGVLSYGGLQIIDGEKTLGEFMSFFAAIALIFEPLRRLGRISGTWQSALVSLERLYTVFQQVPKITSPARPKPLGVDPTRADLVLNDVHFAYGDQPVLRGASFVAEAGKTTALVGASGAGKSTVFNIFTRLIDPQEGAVTIGGTDVREMDLDALRALFSVVTQDTQLFDETIRDNTVMGRNVTEVELEAALEAAHVADFLPKLPEGLDSAAGPRGSALSGGQRQRVAIARALLRNTPILLLDEATSALDAQSEAIVQAALERLSSGRTTLVIAHRLATVRKADKIVVMDAGRVVDEGTHEELMARGGLYANLYRLQFSDSDQRS